VTGPLVEHRHPTDRLPAASGAAGQIRLGADQAAVLLAAVRVLLPPEHDQDLPASGSEPEQLSAAWPALWLRTGQAPLAPTLMPEQPLAPGLIGLFWRRWRAALTLAPRDS
jgi:hypothetical protein